MNKAFSGAILMAGFAAVADAVATRSVYSSTYTANGSFCVDESARDLFAAINDLRAKGTSSTYYTSFKTAADSVAANSYWTSGTTQVTTLDKTIAAKALTELSAFKGQLSPLDWSIGLAAAVQDLYNDFYDNGTTSLTDSKGGNSTTRALAYGSLGSAASTEFAFVMDLASLPVADALTGLLMGEGDSSGAARAAILNAKTKVGAVVAAPNKTGGTAKHFIDLYFADSFTDDASVNKECAYTQNFGGGACDITGNAKDFFNAINSIRANPSTTGNNLFAPVLASWQSGAALAVANSTAPVNLSTDGDGDGIKETYPMTEGKSAVDAAIVAINAKTPQAPLAFNAGLYYSAKDFTDLVASSTGAISLSTSGTTTTSRAQKYGTAPTAPSQSLVTGNYNGLNAVVYLLVDDGNNGARLNQDAIFDANNKYLGVSYTANTVYTNIYTAVYSSDYIVDSNVSCTSTGVILASGTLLQQGSEGAYAGLFVGAATLGAMMAALF